VTYVTSATGRRALAIAGRDSTPAGALMPRTVAATFSLVPPREHLEIAAASVYASRSGTQPRRCVANGRRLQPKPADSGQNERVWPH
jgi:hypothetical protein